MKKIPLIIVVFLGSGLFIRTWTHMSEQPQDCRPEFFTDTSSPMVITISIEILPIYTTENQFEKSF